MDGELFTKIILALITIISGIVSAYVIPFLKSKIKEQDMNRLLTIVEKAIKCAEQVYTPEQWEQKKIYVTNYVKSWLGTLNISITNEQLDAIIEGIVFEVKKEGK